jgi:hypothetical protein
MILRAKTKVGLIDAIVDYLYSDNHEYRERLRLACKTLWLERHGHDNE